MRRRRGLALAAIDLLSGLFLVALVQMAPPPKPASALDTAGAYAVTATWEGSCDVDLHMRTPDGSHVFYEPGNQDVGGASLELDDLGIVNRYVGSQHERIIVRVPRMGEYSVAIHLYDPHECRGPIAVWVVLWKLVGDDRVLLKQRLTLRERGDQATAFRFRLNRRLEFAGHNRLPWDIYG